MLQNTKTKPSFITVFLLLPKLALCPLLCPLPSLQQPPLSSSTLSTFPVSTSERGVFVSSDYLIPLKLGAPSSFCGTHIAGDLFFLCLNNIPLCTCAFSLSAHLQMDTLFESLRAVANVAAINIINVFDIMIPFLLYSHFDSLTP